MLAIILTLWWLAAHESVQWSDARLRPPEWAAVGLVLLLLAAVNAPSIDTISLAVLPVLMGYCLLLLWFQHRESGAMLFDGPLRFDRRSLPAAGLFLAAGVLGYSLDLGAGLSTVLAAAFSAYGLVWLPTVSLVLGVRAYRTMGRQRRL